MNQKQITNLIKLNHELKQNEAKQITAIKSIIIGSSTFLLLSPIYLSSINETNLPIAILSFLEIGSIYLPIRGIKTIIKEKQKMVLTRKKISNQKLDDNLENIHTAYYIVRKDINNRVKKEEKSKRYKKLKKLEKEMNKFCNEFL